MKKLIVILGPTSTGKTDLALKLAKKFNGELISADSRQVYKKLDIGTGKMPTEFKNLEKKNGRWIIDGITIYLYDSISPKKQYTVADYIKEAKEVITKIRKNGKMPILVGGTGLYLKLLIEGLSYLGIPSDKKLRKELGLLSLNQLQTRLKKISPNKWKSLNYSDSQNPRRLTRAIELHISKTDEIESNEPGLAKEFNILKIGLTAQREVLYKTSDQRVVSRVKQGMVEEAENLKKKGLSLKRMKQLGLEYGVLADYLNKDIKNEKELVKILQGRTHNYIRRQLTWFKKEENVEWFDIMDKNFTSQVEKLVRQWYYS